MRNTAAKLTFIILTFNVTFINSRMVIPKEDGTFETRAKPKINVQLRWISLSLVGLRLLLLVIYAMN